MNCLEKARAQKTNREVNETGNFRCLVHLATRLCYVTFARLHSMQTMQHTTLPQYFASIMVGLFDSVATLAIHLELSICIICKSSCSLPSRGAFSSKQAEIRNKVRVRDRDIERDRERGQEKVRVRWKCMTRARQRV